MFKIVHQSKNCSQDLLVSEEFQFPIEYVSDFQSNFKCVLIVFGLV